MPMGVVSDADFEAELDAGKARAVEFTRTPEKGRGKDTPNVPDSLRKIIGEEAVINGRTAALEIAREFGISDSSVSAYTKAATSTATYNTPSKSLISHINKSRQRHIKRAGHVLNNALSAISQEKLDYAEAKDLSGIAKDMSVIIKNLEPAPATPSQQSNSQQNFVIYAPSFRKEESFEVIDVKE